MRLYNGYTRPLAVKKTVTVAAETPEPVLASELEEWLYIDGAEQRNTLNALIKAARIRCEQLANQDFVPKSYVFEFDDFVSNFETNIYPLVPSPITVTYWDADDNDMEYATANIRVDGTSIIFTEVVEVYDRHDAVTVECTSSPNPENLEIVKMAIRLLVGKWWDNRATQKQEVPDMVEVMMNAIRIIKC